MDMEESTAVDGEVNVRLQMDDKGPKTVFSNQDFSGSLVTIFAEQSKRTAENKTIRRTLPGKSHVSRIILHDNTSQERLLDMKLADIKNSQRKMDAFMTHQKKTFLKRMEKKYSSWSREHSRQAVDFNSKGNKSIEYMLEMMRADQVGGSGGSPTDLEGDGVADTQGNAEDEASKLPTLSEKEYAIAMSQARVPERKLRHRTTGIPSLPLLMTLPTHLTQKGEQNPFLTTSDHEETLSERASENDLQLQLKKSDTLVSFSNRSGRDMSLPRMGRKVSVISNVSVRSQTAPRVTNAASLPALNHSKNGKARPKTDPTNSYPSYSKQITSQLPRLSGPEPTFISEILPQINTSDPTVTRLQTQHQLKKSRRSKRRARAKEASKREASQNPLDDERFVSLQNFLSPVPADHECRDIGALSHGIAAAKRLVRRHQTDYSDLDDTDGEN